ncbi:MAG TPA: hypothetical protein VHE30_07515 [Polyangiaceae bacterium]|nr:hypothetical protein [Polyangiaceae bacterium]
MSSLIDVAPSAEGLPLARTLAARIRENVRAGRTRAHFDRLRGSVGIVAVDAGEALTLRFDFGRLVVHGGIVGVPDVTLRGPLAVLGALGERGRPTLLDLFRPNDRSPAAGLTVYGLATHPLLVRSLFAILRSV